MGMRFARVAATLLLAVGLIAAPVAAAEGQIQVLVQGAPVQFDAAPFIESGRTLVPLRALSEQLGFTVDWEPTEQRITLSKGNAGLVLWVGRLEAQVNGTTFTLDAAPQILAGNRTFVPLRFVSEHLGAHVHWDGEKQHVRVTPDGESDLEAFSYLVATPAELARMSTQGEFSLQMTQPGQGSSAFLGTLTSLQNGSNLLGTLDLKVPMGEQALPLAQLQVATRDGFGWLKVGGALAGLTGSANWQSLGPIAPTAGYEARLDRATGLLLPLNSLLDYAVQPGSGGSLFADPAQLQAQLKDQIRVTYGPAEIKDGVRLVRLDVNLHNLEIAKLLSAIPGGAASGLMPAEMPQMAAKLSLLVEEESKLLRSMTMDATGADPSGATMAMRLQMSYDPTTQSISWPADLPAAQP